MKRRLSSAFVLVCMLAGLFACQPKSEETGLKEYPMFWTWMNYHPKANFDSICRVLNETGIDGLVLNARSADDFRQAVPIANKYGIEVYSWLWTINDASLGKEHPEWLSVNRNGKSLADTMAYVGYYKFLCPALPEVREAMRKKVAELCEVEGLAGIAIDYHRLVDVVLPTTLWPKYGIEQDREYAAWDYGYHPAMIEKFEALYGYDPREQEDPSQDLKWRQFRCDQVTEVANFIAETVHSYGKVMAASPFPTPKMSARMVRQDWGKWNLDIVFPMVYHNFYTEDVSFIRDCTIENARDKNPMTTLYCGMMVTKGGQEVFDCMDAALNNGAQGIALFTADGLRTPEIRSRFKEYADSARAARRANGGVVKAEYPSVADADPFTHTTMMQTIEQRMKELLANETDVTEPAPLQLGEYVQIDAYDATRRYHVKDAASGKTFAVTFYFYGDVVSGWKVDLTDN